ncbi:MAG: choice-of-anchor D domain-containing protein, partial [Verrucomicrobiales bacterium]|nr:choice-of-anchor D domain-containing protein [Verrucomicrobiales bacterium]
SNGGEFTGPLPYNASAAAVQAALESLSPIGVGNVAVTQEKGLFVNDDTTFYRSVFTLTFPRGFTGTLGPRITILQTAPIATIDSIYYLGLLAGQKNLQLLDPNLELLLYGAVYSRFVDFTNGITVADAPNGPNTISVIWEQGGVRSHFGSPTVPGGVGIDNSIALRDLIRNHSRERLGIQAFLLAKALNQSYPANLEVYPNQILMEYLTAPMDPGPRSFFSLVGNVVAHEAAHTLGALHVSQVTKRTVMANDQQQIQLRTDLDPPPSNSEIAFILGGVYGPQTARMKLLASASEIEESLQALKLVEPQYLGSNYVRVTGNLGGPWTVSFIGRLRGVDVAPLDVSLYAPDSGSENTGNYHVDTFDGLSSFEVKGYKPPANTDAADLLSNGTLVPLNASGFLDFSMQPEFQAGLSREIVRMGLKLDWTFEDANRALELVHSASRIKPLMSGLDETDGGEFLVTEPHLEVLASDGSINPATLNFGNVRLGEPPATNVITLRNLGATALTIRDARLANAATTFQVQPVAGTVIPGGEEIGVALTFNPAVSGELADVLEISTNDRQGTYRLDLAGFGRSPAADIRVLVGMNNVGGVAIGSAKLLPGFAMITNLGSQPLTVTAVNTSSSRGNGQFAVPPLTPALPLTIQPGGASPFDLLFDPGDTGLQRVTIEVRSNDPDTPVYSVQVTGTGLPASGNPRDTLQYGNDYVAMESPDFPNGPVLRAKSDNVGNFSFFLPPDQRYHAVLFDPVSGLVAHLSGITATSGQNTHLGTPVFAASIAPDADDDGLPDDIEFAIGTDPNKADTDGNGVDDFTEVMQGRDPLAGRAVTGIIGRVSTRNARNVSLVAPNATDPATLHAYLADAFEGLIIVDVSRPSVPVVLGKLPLPGELRDAAVDLDTRIAVGVASRGADNRQGTHLVDISDPVAPKLLKSLEFAAHEVECASGFAYVASSALASATLRSIDLTTQSVQDEMDLPGGSLFSMAREAHFLYVLQEAGMLRVISIDAGQMTLQGTLSVPLAINRLSVGGGIAYLPIDEPSRAFSGFGTADVRDPANPKVIRLPTSPTIAPRVVSFNGSGAVLVGGFGGDGQDIFALDLMNATDPTNTDSLITRFFLPGVPSAVALGSGFAFVADGDAGLVIVNYLSSDTAGRAPVIRSVEVLPDADAGRPGPQVLEGSVFHVRVGLIDDVEVHSVELLVNGQVVQRSVSAPFNLSSVAPAMIAQASNLVVQVRATDTGGNTTLSGPVLAEFVSDPGLPRLVQVEPADGEMKDRGLRSAHLTFSEPMAKSASDLANFQLSRSNGETVSLKSSTLEDGDRAVQLEFDPLEPGEYRLVLRAASIMDRAGNALGTADLFTGFTVDRYSIRWVHPGTGNWLQPTNWIPQRVPGPEDSVLIDVKDTNFVVHVIGRFFAESRLGVLQPIQVRSIDCNAQLSLLYTDFHVDEPFQLKNRFVLTASRLTDTILVSSPNS